MRSLFAVVLVPLAGLMVFACDDGTTTTRLVKVPREAGTSDAGAGGAGCVGSPCEADGGLTADSGDAGERAPTPVPDPNYPTTHASLPLLRYAHGNVMDAPKVVTVTFDNDTSRDLLEGFGDTITATPWWDAVSAGYCDDRGVCVGRGAGGGHVRVASPGASLADAAGNTASSSLKLYIDSQIQSGAFPAPDARTIYLLYTPNSTTVTLDGNVSCRDFAGFHNSMVTTPPGGGAPVTFTYAVVARCQDADSVMTFVASHELIEAATDPIFDEVAKVQKGWTSTTDAWDVLGGGEVADRCFDLSGHRGDLYREGPYTVTRSWSNLAAAASHDPCVPAQPPDKLPYFNVMPEHGDVLTLKVGQPVTVPIVAFTDAPLPPVTLSVTEQSGQLGLLSVLNVSLDTETAQNGQVVNLTVTLVATPGLGYAPFVVTSTLGPFQHQSQFIVRTP